MSSKPILIGITGGIGSGKSTVCKILETLDYQIYYADDRGKWLMNNDATLKSKVITLFGKEAYTDDWLNRKFIADQVFKSPSLLNKLNAIVHPAVAEDLKKWVLNHSDEEMLFDEAALLFETGSYKKMDRTILVSAPEDLRIKRVIHRDKHRSVDSVKEIISQQMKDEEKVRLADYTITNDGQQSLIKQVMEILTQLH